MTTQRLNGCLEDGICVMLDHDGNRRPAFVACTMPAPYREGEAVERQPHPADSALQQHLPCCSKAVMSDARSPVLMTSAGSTKYRVTGDQVCLLRQSRNSMVAFTTISLYRIDSFVNRN